MPTRPDKKLLIGNIGIEENKKRDGHYHLTFTYSSFSFDNMQDTKEAEKFVEWIKTSPIGNVTSSYPGAFEWEGDRDQAYRFIKHRLADYIDWNGVNADSMAHELEEKLGMGEVAKAMREKATGASR